VIAYLTDSCYALGCRLGKADGITRIRTIHHLDDQHHLTLVCQDFAQLGQFAYVANPVFRAIKAATPGSYTFVLPANKEVPRKLQHPRKKTVGEPLVSSTLLLPGQDEPRRHLSAGVCADLAVLRPLGGNRQPGSWWSWVDHPAHLARRLDVSGRRPVFGWLILADPEGNEFCVEFSRAERDAVEATASQADG
jgi:Telomere recombination